MAVKLGEDHIAVAGYEHQMTDQHYDVSQDNEYLNNDRQDDVLLDVGSQIDEHQTGELQMIDEEHQDDEKVEHYQELQADEVVVVQLAVTTMCCLQHSLEGKKNTFLRLVNEFVSRKLNN